MLNLKMSSLNEIVADTPGLLVNGDWVCLNIDTRTAWPTKPQSFVFEGRQVWVMPLTTDHYPGLAANKPANIERDECFALLHRALSVLAWLQDTGAIVVHMSGGNLPRMMGRQQSTGNAIRDEFDLSDLPEIEDASGRLALALIREGRGLNHPGYSFLSFFSRARNGNPPTGQPGALGSLRTSIALRATARRTLSISSKRTFKATSANIFENPVGTQSRTRRPTLLSTRTTRGTPGDWKRNGRLLKHWRCWRSKTI